MSLLVYEANAVANHACENLFESRTTNKRDQSIQETKAKGVPLHTVGKALMGYEFLHGRRIFSDPVAAREAIDRIKTYLPNSEINIKVFGFRSIESAYYEIANKLPSQLPEKIGYELMAYVNAILFDVKRRNFKTSNLILLVRTDSSPTKFKAGHNHSGQGSLTYTHAEIGSDTEVDSKDRLAPAEMSDDDYIRAPSNEWVTVFGDVFHRTPPDTGPRLYIAIAFESEAVTGPPTGGR